MSLGVEALLEMLQEIEAVDPIDFGELPFGEQELRRLVLCSLVERHTQLEHDGMAVIDIHALYLLSAAKLVLENTVLHAKLLTLRGEPVDVQALLAPFKLRAKPEPE